MREAEGEWSVGRKIGFTNRTIWDEYNVHAPIWGWMYRGSIHEVADMADGFSLFGLAEPRIEPEIVFGLSEAPGPGMDVAALLGCVGWVAHGFEIVQSIFPGWVFTPADTVAAYGLHGAMLIGSKQPIAGHHERWLDSLSTFEIELIRDGDLADRGSARNVLGGPLFALKHLNDLLADGQSGPPLAAGETITTGTLTRALPVASGQTWSTRLNGVDLPPLTVRFR
jgi:2-oxo-3-hexenedioate decarboxylase